jgi:hypothetical protein
MNIKFTDNKAGHNYTDAKLLIWNIQAKVFNKKIVNQYAIGLLFLIIGIVTFNNTVWRSVGDNATKEHNFHLLFTLGIVWLFLTAVRHLGLAKEKEKYMRSVADNAVRRFAKSNTQSVDINDNVVLAYSDESKSETSWTLITHFKLLDNFIFLIPDEDLNAAIIVDKRLLSPADSDQLLTFLKTSKKEWTR